MKLLKIVLRFIRRGLLCPLLPYEAIFIFGSIITLLFWGPHGVGSWYYHVFGVPLIGGSCIGDTCTFELAPWDLHRLGWARFWAIQFLYVVVTVWLGSLEWRWRAENNSRERGTENG